MTEAYDTADNQQMQSWLRDTGKLLLAERKRTRNLSATLAERERQQRELESRNWLLEQTVAALKQELREVINLYQSCQQELSATRHQLAEERQARQQLMLVERADRPQPAPQPNPSPLAPRVRPANQHTPAPGQEVGLSRLRGVDAPERRRLPRA